MYVFEKKSAVEFVGVFEGEVTAMGGRPAVGRFLEQHFVEISACFFVGVLAFPAWGEMYMTDRMRG